MPRALLLNTTTFCQARCEFCIVLDKLNRPELNMTDEQIYKALDEARAEGATEVGYSGGEPTIDPRFLDIVAYARKIGYTHQTVITNGIRFKQKAFVEQMVVAGLTSVDISIHGCTEEMHDTLVAKKGAFAAIVEGCGHLRELQKTHNFFISGTVVVTKANHPELKEICQFLHSIGMSNLRLKYAYEGNMSHDAIINQVAPYEQVVPSIIDALDYLASQTKGFHVTHIPLCLLGDHAVFSQDFLQHRPRQVFKTNQVEGVAGQFFRKDGDACTGCALNSVCTRLDNGYEQFHGRPELKPFADAAAVEALFSRGLKRFTIPQRHIRSVLDTHRRNRDGGASAPTGNRPPPPPPPGQVVPLKVGGSSAT